MGAQWDNKPDSPGFSIFWAIYNTCILAITIQVAIDVPQKVLSLSFPHQLPCQLTLDAHKIEAVTVEISQKGARLQLAVPVLHTHLNAMERVDIPSIGLVNVPVSISNSNYGSGGIPEVEIEFVSLSLEQERYLVEFLFCRPGQWQETTISETKSLWALLSSIFRFYPLAETNKVNSTTSVNSANSYISQPVDFKFIDCDKPKVGNRK